MSRKNDLLIINKLDNVGIDLSDGHKYALRDIAEGENIIKYGQPIGHATENIAEGDHVHTHNVKTNLSGKLEYKYEKSEVYDEKRNTDIIYEPNCEDVFAAIVPEYLGGILYGALCESRAAEQAARRSAMDSATQNAEEMIEDLSLKFNRARQAAITQEITEIVAGS